VRFFQREPVIELARSCRISRSRGGLDLTSASRDAFITRARPLSDTSTDVRSSCCKRKEVVEVGHAGRRELQASTER
jgi:hypothetical protein